MQVYEEGSDDEFEQDEQSSNALLNYNANKGNFMPDTGKTERTLSIVREVVDAVTMAFRPEQEDIAMHTYE